MVCYVLVIGAAAWTAYVNLNPHAHGYDIIVNGPAHIKDPYRVIDERMRFAGERGNVLLLFTGLDDETDPTLHSIGQFYCRGSYDVYPHRILLGDDQIPFNNDQLSVKHFDPTPQWLEQHNVHCIFRVFREPDGRYETELDPV